MADSVRMERRPDGLVNVIVEGLAPAVAGPLAERILSGGATVAPRTARKAPAQASRRKKATLVRCRFCGKLIGPQGRVSHERRNHPGELAKEAARKARKAS